MVDSDILCTDVKTRFFTCVLCQVESGLHSRVPVGCYSDYNAIMVTSARPHPVLGKPLMRN